MLKTLLASGALIAAAAAAPAQDFNFVLLGDAPYGEPETVYPKFEALIGAINAREPELVIHIGDTKSGSTECSDQILNDQLGYLNSFTAPTLYSLGDNEWTDCHRAKAGGYDPLERLAYIRKTYFADPSTSLGAHPAPVESQADKGYPENARMAMNGILFVTSNVIGSNNNFEPRDIEAVKEFMARDAADVEWLRESFAKARDTDAKAVVVAIQADMFEFDFGLEGDPEGFIGQSGFQNFAAVLVEEANAFNKPVLLVFGDSHVFRMFRPFPNGAPMIMALETFGSADMHAVEVYVHPDDSFPFAVQPLYNPAQPVTRKE